MANIVVSVRTNAVKVEFNTYSSDQGYSELRINKNQLSLCELVDSSEEIKWYTDGRVLRVARTATTDCMIIDDVAGVTTFANQSALADALDALM